MSTVSSIVTCVLAIVLLGRGEVTASDEELSPQTNGFSNHRQPRHLSKLCYKFGVCGGQGHGGYQGGYQGGYGGYQGGYPPINIGISQSQSSASAGGGGFGSGHFPNYQYNGFPGGYNNGYQGGFNGYPGGFNRPGYFGNGFGPYNNQFNGNFGGQPQGGFGFQGPFGNFYDEGNNVKPVHENQEDFSRSAKSKD